MPQNVRPVVCAGCPETPAGGAQNDGHRAVHRCAITGVRCRSTNSRRLRREPDRHPVRAALGRSDRQRSWCGKMSICPKLIVPLQIDRALGVRRYLLGRWLAQARQVTHRCRQQAAFSAHGSISQASHRRGVAGVFRIRGPERGGDDRARIGYTPGRRSVRTGRRRNSSRRASILGRHVIRGRAVAAPSRGFCALPSWRLLRGLGLNCV